jgi:nucleotide-binding universal stress UspA family protein
MSYATVMVHVDLDRGSDARIRLAAGVADRFDATLIGLAGCLPVPPFDRGDLAVPQASAAAEQAAAHLAQRGEEFRAIVGPGRTRLDWRADLDDPGDLMVREARAADLLVIGRDRTRDLSFGPLVPGRTILRAGRPVLAVPPGIQSLQAERVVIGWKDTREARRALQDALPFLHRAKWATLIEICDHGMEDEGQRHLEDVARYLKWHRVPVGPLLAVHTTDDVAHELIRSASDEDADLIVAGAYGHSRLGEWLFGGVTQELLASSPVCCLFAH